PRPFLCLLFLRRSPRSTLFPYTTLSDLDYKRFGYDVEVVHSADFVARLTRGSATGSASLSGERSGGASEPSGTARERVTFHDPRSEEHTSELQSRFDLVCRLLLEKKKKS